MSYRLRSLDLTAAHDESASVISASRWASWLAEDINPGVAERSAPGFTACAGVLTRGTSIAGGAAG